MLDTKFSRFLCLIALLFIESYVSAQSPNFKHFTVENNLPSSECYQVLQDKKGYIWIATDKGVARFDGNKFQNFTKDDGLPENCIIRMYEDPFGRIWFASVSNKIAYFEKNKITPLKINDNFSKKKDIGFVSSMAFCENTLWLGMYSSSHIFKITFSKGKSLDPLKYQKILEINQKEKITGNYIIKLKNREHIQGMAALTDLKEIRNSWGFTFVTNSKKYASKNVFLDAFSLNEIFNPNVRSIRCRDNNYLFYFTHKIIKINHKNGQITKKIKVNEKINYLFSDSKNGIWIGTDKKGLLYYPKGDVGKSHPLAFLKNKSISGIMEDHEHGFWISTLEEGIFYVKDINFYHLTGLSSPRVNTVCYFDKTLFAGLDNGYLISLRDTIYKEICANLKPLDINYIHKIIQNKKGSLAIGGTKGFCYLDLKANKFKWHTTYWWNEKKPSLTHTVSRTLVKAKAKNSYWITIYKAIIKVYDSDKTKVIPVNHRLFSLAEDNHGNIWLGTLVGLFRYDGKKFTFEGKNSPTLSGRIDELQIKNNIIWAATKDNGITIKKGNTNYDITTKNGLISNICQSIFLESERIAWVATNKGICKITINSWSPFKISTKTYNSTNGLISNEINQITKNGSMVYIASNKGVTWFNEKKVNVNLASPPIHITSLQINKKDTSVQPTYFLPHDQNNITLNFVGLTYKSEGDIEYKYRMEGLDTNWNYTHNTTIPYNTLPYGNYTFTVSAKNNDGYWSTIPAKINFVISPPFWHTWIFRILAGLTFLGIVYWIFQWRIKIVKKRANETAKLYQQTVDMEMKFLSSQMNPHFTFNAMNSIQYYMMENEPEQAQRYLVKYSRLMRTVLENNMKQFVKLADEIEMLTLYMDIESMRFKIQFEYEVNIDDQLKEMNLSISPMIIQPYIENAIWHGLSNNREKKGKISLSFELLNDKIKCTIEDNGIGRAKANKLKTVNSNKQSLGMFITHQRLQQLQSKSVVEKKTDILDKVDEDGVGCGTKVIIYLPFIQTVDEIIND